MSDRTGAGGESTGAARESLDYRSTRRGEAREASFPVPIADEFRVYLSENAYARMKAHVGTSNEVELGGVLLGDVLHDKDGYFLRIGAIVEGEATHNYGAQVTFTHDTWSHINRIKDQKYPDLRIVGWYHSHPGFGVFLSQMDTFIQENFFNQPYQVAIVLETRQQAEGCFAWVGGKPTALKRFWVGDREVGLATGRAEEFTGGGVCDGTPGQATEAAAVPAGHTGGGGPERWRLPVWAGGVALVLGVALGLLAGWVSTNRDLQGYESEIYSLFETAALSDKMDVDLRQLEALLREAGGSADPASKERLAAIASQAALMREWYDTPRRQYRKSIQDLVSVKQGLYARLSGSEQRVASIEDMVAQLYLIQVAQMLGRGGSADLAALRPEERAFAKNCLDAVLRLRPASKEQVRMLMPEVFETFYPEAGKGGDR